MHKVSKGYLKEYGTILEYRHIFGCLFDDDGPVSIDREIECFYKVEAALQHMYPLMKIKIIVCGLKLLGREHIQAMLDSIVERKDKGYKMIAGFDMVNEEDYWSPIDTFLD